MRCSDELVFQHFGQDGALALLHFVAPGQALMKGDPIKSTIAETILPSMFLKGLNAFRESHSRAFVKMFKVNDEMIAGLQATFLHAPCNISSPFTKRPDAIPTTFDTSRTMSSADYYYYEPTNGHGLRHNPFNAIIGPRPIGWISTRSKDGFLNLAPYSYFNAFASAPPIIGFSSTGAKDTLRNAQQTAEFVWNLATRPLAAQMNQTSATVAREISEFELAGLTPVASKLVAAPRVAESPVSFECKVTQILQLTDQRGSALPNWMVFGEVVAVHIESSLIATGVYDTAAARPVLRAGGRDAFAEIAPEIMFSMTRPA